MDGRGRLGVCALLAVPVVVLHAVPALRFDHWPWICLTLAAPAAVGCAWPVHRDAAGALGRGRVGADVPAAVALLATLGWSVAVLLATPGDTPPVDGAFLDVTAAAALGVLLGRAALPAVRHDRSVVVIGTLTVALAVGTLGFRLGSGAGPTAALAASFAVLLVACPAALVVVVAPHTPPPPEPVAPDEHVLADVHPAPDSDGAEALRLAGSVLAGSADAIGRAVAAAATARAGELPAVAEFDEEPGRGARGIVAELCAPPGDDTGVRAVVAHAVLVGTPEMLAEHGIAMDDELGTRHDEIDAAGRTAVAVAWDGRARAVLALDRVPAPTGAVTTPDPGRVGALRGLRRPVLLGYHLVALPAAAAGLVDPLLATATATLVSVLAAIEARGSQRS